MILSIYASIFMHAYIPNPSICPSFHTHIQAHLVGEFPPIKVPLGKAPRLGCIIGPRACAGMLCSAQRVVACMSERQLISTARTRQQHSGHIANAKTHRCPYACASVCLYT